MAFVTTGNSTPSYTTGLIKEITEFSVFDPHSRNKDGMCCSDGTAVVTYHNGLNDIFKRYEDLARSIAITESTFDFVPVEFQLKPTHSDSNDENSSFNGFSDTVDSEDKPLSRLSSKLKTLSKEQHAHYKEESFKPTGLEEDLDQLSYQEKLNISGSEYKPTKFEKKMMASHMSSSNLDSSESSVLLSPKMKRS